MEPKQSEELLAAIRGLSVNEVVIDSDSVTFAPRVMREMQIPPFPEGVTLVLEHVGLGTDRPILHFSQSPPEVVTFRIEAGCDYLEWDGAELHRVVVDLAVHPEPFEYNGGLARDLTIHDGDAQIPNRVPVPARLELVGRLRCAGASLAQAWILDDLVLAGEVRFPNNGIQASNAQIHRGTSLLAGTMRLLLPEWRTALTDSDLRAALTESDLRVAAGASVSVLRLPDQSRLFLDAGHVAVERSARGPEIKQLRCEGMGRLTVAGTVVGLDLASREGMTLVVEQNGQVLDATGRAVVEVSPRGTLRGSRSDPLRLQPGSRSEGEMLDVDIYDLHVSDLTSLKSGVTLSPWVPRRLGDHTQDRSRRRGMRLGGGDASTILDKREFFLTSLSSLLKEQHARGHVQSRYRYLSKQARRAASPRNREWLWLSLYRLVGFGERITQPLLTWALASLAIASALVRGRNPVNRCVEASGIDGCISAVQAFWPTLSLAWWQMALSPLAALRVNGVAGTSALDLGREAVLAPTLYGAGQALGLVLVGISVFAIVQVVKAD